MEEVDFNRSRVKHQRVIPFARGGGLLQMEEVHLNRSRVKHKRVLLLLKEGRI